MRLAFLIGILLIAIDANPSFAASLLRNGDFEVTTSTVSPDGTLRFDGWTQRLRNGGVSGIYLEGRNNGLSSFDISADQFDGPASAAPDPYFPYQSPSDPRLDYIAYVRSSGSAPTNSYAELVSDVFVIDGSISADVWREASNAVSIVSFLRASDDQVLAAFTVTSTPQRWSRVTFDTTPFIGERAYVVLHGGTSQAGLGWLTMFDNVTGGVTVVTAVPEPASILLVLVGCGALLLRFRAGSPGRSGFRSSAA